MRRRSLLTLLFCLAAAMPTGTAAAASSDQAPGPRRIVSLAPSITELVCALGLGERLVGVTDWCAWPPEVAELPSVGGHVDPNLEAVVALRPDLVVVEAAHVDICEGLLKLGLATCIVEHRDVLGILASVSTVGERCGVNDLAKALRDDLDARMAAVVGSRPAGPRPRVMLVVGRNVASGRLGDLYLAGGGTFLGELLLLAGGVNVIEDGAVKYPVISREGLLRLAPEVVIDLAPECADDPSRRVALEKAWSRLEDVPAVASDRVHVSVDGAMLVPGPRFIETLEFLASTLER